MGRASGRGEKGPVLVALRCKEQSRFAFTAGGTQGLLLWTESRTPQSTAGCAGNQELDIWDGLGQSPDPTWRNPQLFWDGRQLWRPPAQLLTLSQHWGHTRRSGACPGHKTLQGQRQTFPCTLPPSQGMLPGREGQELPGPVQEVWDLQGLQAQGKEKRKQPGGIPDSLEGFRWEIRNIKTSHCVIKRGVKSANSLENPEYY